MTDQLSSYRNYGTEIRALLLFAGLWPSRKLDDSPAYRLLPLLNALACFTMSCVVLNFCREHSNNLDLLTKGIGIMGSYVSSVLKLKSDVVKLTKPFKLNFYRTDLRLKKSTLYRSSVVCFLANHRELMDLHRTLENYFEESLADGDTRREIFDVLSIFVKPSFAITILLFTGTIVFLLTPMIVIVVQLSHNVYPLKFILPYPGKYPWPFEGGSLVYCLHYTWEILAGLFLTCSTSGVDSLFGYYVFQIRATFRLMSSRMRKLGGTNDPSNDDDIVRDCLTKYEILEKCRDQLQSIYGPIVFWMFLTSAIIMCTLIFQASETREWTVGYAILFTVYISMKLLQSLMYAWYGSIVHTESEEFRNAVYSSGWPGSGDVSLMNNILILMSHKPMVLTACKFLIVSTDMFTAIVNATMSYFFLLQTLNERN